MNFNYSMILGTFVIGLIVCFTLTMFLGDTEVFIGMAIIYLAAIIAGKNINHNIK